MIVEVCANSFESAKNADVANASRIELCSELGVGGITPSYGLIKKVMNDLNIVTHVLIRPRSGNFTFSEEEFECMQQDIELCKSLGCQGIVSGVLNLDNTIDVKRTKKLVDLAYPMSFTFHRAFDLVPNPIASIAILEDLGVNCILSSGQQPKAFDGLALLQEMQHQTKKILIMPGSGINAENIDAFVNSGFKAVHFSAISNDDDNTNNNQRISFISYKLLETLTPWISNKNRINEVIAKLNNR